MKKILFTVINSLSFDQRMERICTALAEAGFTVELIGRKTDVSLALKEKPYKQKELNCFIQSGKLFYLEYNIRLFFYLLFRKCDAICAIDLDTIVPCYIVSRLRSKKIIYDAHEYFTELIEVVHRPAVRKVWLSIESFFVPRCDIAYTVSESIKNIFNEKYKTNFRLIRNVARLENHEVRHDKEEKYLIYIGAVNAGRGLEQLIEAMRFIDCKLYICGKGDLFDAMVKLSEELKVADKVRFLGFVEPEKLKTLTRNAYLGFLLLDNSSKSYYYSLANKFFDYIHAGIPQITVDFPEYRFINERYKVAELIALDVAEIVKAVHKLLNDKAYYQSIVDNTIAAREAYNWQKESQALLEIYQAI